GDDFCFLLSPHIVARTPRKRPIMTSDHADKMEITVVFQCPPLGKVGMGPQLALLPLGRLRWGFLYIMYFSISLWENRYSQQDIYLY
ncbi:hypothetical protein, partial [Prevotella dentalis]|uniref:hypothetical protein n=1 Tax=Prevotella dentalis TaxID=52227 RepID=UPI00265B58E8